MMDRRKWKRLYNAWHDMVRRCSDHEYHGYKNYGAKGISICDEWKSSFRAFQKWATENGFADGLTIDRINNKLGYFPENCRWVTYREQNRNYSRNHIITYNGKSMCIADWSDETGIKQATILARIKRGWSVDKLFDDVRTYHRHRNWSDAT